MQKNQMFWGWKMFAAGEAGANFHTLPDISIIYDKKS